MLREALVLLVYALAEALIMLAEAPVLLNCALAWKLNVPTALIYLGEIALSNNCITRSYVATELVRQERRLA